MCALREVNAEGEVYQRGISFETTEQILLKFGNGRVSVLQCSD
jgi:hypothetical protein